MFFINLKKTTSSFKTFSSSELKQLVWCLNTLINQKFSRKISIPYSRLNFQICQFLMRRGFLSSVSLIRAKKTDYLPGVIFVHIRLIDNKVPFTRALLQEFYYTRKPRQYLANSSVNFSWWKLKPYRNAKLVIIKTAFGLMTAHECVYYRVGGRILLILF